MTTLKTSVDEWNKLPWKKFQKTLFHLQHRIYKASKDKDFALVKNLQQLLIGSKSSKYLAVRQVTQLNTGKRTPGVDKISSLNPKERLNLVSNLDQMKKWKHRKIRRVFIPKSNGKQRPLGIPTIRDRAMQCLIKFALEPVYESYASDGSYGFRPGHSTWDIQSRLFNNLRSTCKGYEKRILEIDIEDCFNQINHNKLMSMITLPGNAKRVILSALKAGVLNECSITEKGTSQGGVISPLLCNIALHGIEDLNNQWAYSRWWQRGYRYADDIVYILKPDECSETLLENIKSFLSERGLKINDTKTSLVPATSGFDFLGWHFKVKPKNNKFVSYPSKKNRKAMIDRVKKVMRDSRYKIKARLNMVKTIYRSWWNYHQFCDMSQINLWSIQNWVYKYTKKKSKIATEELVSHIQSIFNGHQYKVNKHSSVRGDLSIYDGNFIYWVKKNSKHYNGPMFKAIKSQNYTCNSCGLKLMPSDHIELHHKNGNNKDQRTSNLEALHRSCHHYQPIHKEILKQRKRR